MISKELIWQIGWILLAAAVVVTSIGVVQEWRAREPKYMLLIKIGSILFGISGGLIGFFR